MKIGDFELTIPEGSEGAGAYTHLAHGAKYTLKLRNNSRNKCDVRVMIDGGHVGTFRLRSFDSCRIERPVHENGFFTFYRAGTPEARAAGIEAGDNLGLISATFMREAGAPELLSLNASKAGGTGLSGKSEQGFSDASEIKHVPEGEFVTIFLRLCAADDAPRPLFGKSNPAPPPIGRA